MSRLFAIDEVIRVLDVPEEFVRLLEREEIVRAEQGWFTAEAVERIRVCRTLHYDLGVNIEGVEVALHLLDMLERERRRQLDLLRRVAELVER